MPRVSITVPDKKSQPYRFALDRKTVTLGRGSENDIVVDCASVSVRHAVMERLKGRYELRDLGSTNGTKLDGKAQDVIVLKDGLAVKIGDVAFDFSLSEEETATLLSERPADGEAGDRPSGATPRPETKARLAPSSAPPRPVVTSTQPSGGASFLMALLFIFLTAASFFIGLSIRHQKETGRSLIQDIKHGVPQEETTENPAGEGSPTE